MERMIMSKWGGTLLVVSLSFVTALIANNIMIDADPAPATAALRAWYYAAGIGIGFHVGINWTKRH